MMHFISDTHWGHKNILEFDKRPFATIEEHDEALIKNWNDKVARTDEVWHHGDVTFSSVTLERIMPRLNGKIHLIRGNHDDKAAWKLRHKWFASFHESLYLKVAGVGLHLSHYPIEEWRNSRRGCIHLHGHVHGNLNSYIQGRLDISANVIGYTPISFDEVLEAVKIPVEEWYAARIIPGDGKFHERV